MQSETTPGNWVRKGINVLTPEETFVQKENVKSSGERDSTLTTNAEFIRTCKSFRFADVINKLTQLQLHLDDAQAKENSSREEIQALKNKVASLETSLLYERTNNSKPDQEDPSEKQTRKRNNTSKARAW